MTTSRQARVQFLTRTLSIFDARSFSSPWFWLVLLACWMISGRGVLGVPNDVVIRAGRALRDPAGAPDDAVLLLDWLSLHVPRWRIGRVGGAVLSGLVGFAVTALAVLGFSFGLEMAQALTLLVVPFALLLALRMRLAHQLRWVLEAARYGQPARETADAALRRINRFRVLHMLIAILSVIVTAFYASFWILLHPNGL